jgi:pimeloyl-ACP methyl ester carboxylesterase
MSSTKSVSITVPTQFLELSGGGRYAYRRFGTRRGNDHPLLLLQHFTGTLDNWDPALTDALAEGREVILFDNAGVGRSSGEVPTTVAGMAKHAEAFLEGLGISTCDVLGFSLGGMVAQQMVLDRPAVFRRMILVGTAPRGGEDIMHLEKPRLAQPIQDPANKGTVVLQKIFFTLTFAGQAAGAAFVERLTHRKTDLEGPSGPQVANAQMASFRDWERFTGKRFSDLHGIRQPTLVINGVHDEMIPVANSYWLSENLPNSMLLTYPDAGHGSLFQYHDSFARHVEAFLAVQTDSAVY